RLTNRSGRSPGHRGTHGTDVLAGRSGAGVPHRRLPGARSGRHCIAIDAENGHHQRRGRIRQRDTGFLSLTRGGSKDPERRYWETPVNETAPPTTAVALVRLTTISAVPGAGDKLYQSPAPGPFWF